MRTRPSCTAHTAARTPVLVLWSIVAACLAAAPMGCTRAYMDALEQEMSLAPPELLHLRAREARDALEHTHTALLHLGDDLRQLALVPRHDAQRAATNLQRRAEQLDAAAWDARRRIASINDVAPGYLRPDPHQPVDPAPRPPEEVPHSYSALARSLDNADHSLEAVNAAVREALPTLGDAPDPGAINALAGPIEAALRSTSNALAAIDEFLLALP